MGLPVKYIFGLGGLFAQAVMRDPEKIVNQVSGDLIDFFLTVEKVAVAVGDRARHIATAADELAGAAHRMAEAIAKPVVLEE